MPLIDGKFENPSDEALRKILTETRTIALVGASDKIHRPSNEVLGIMLDHGRWDVIPINPVLKGSLIHGQEVVASLNDLDTPVDMVEIFRRSDKAEALVLQEVLAMSPLPKAIWCQIGVILSNRAIQKVDKSGIELVMDKCPAEELPRLGIYPSSSKRKSKRKLCSKRKRQEDES